MRWTATKNGALAPFFVTYGSALSFKLACFPRIFVKIRQPKLNSR